jgi:hypothetical protein
MLLLLLLLLARPLYSVKVGKQAAKPSLECLLSTCSWRRGKGAERGRDEEVRSGGSGVSQSCGAVVQRCRGTERAAAAEGSCSR